MSRIRVRPETGKLYFDFHYLTVRCREYSALPDNAANRANMQKVLARIEAEITLGTFQYRKYFPNSEHAVKFDGRTQATVPGQRPASKTPLFSEFGKDWWTESEVRWRQGTKDSMAGTVNGRLVPRFGNKAVSDITRQEILTFRAELARAAGHHPGSTLSPKTVNQVITVLKASH